MKNPKNNTPIIYNLFAISLFFFLVSIHKTRASDDPFGDPDFFGSDPGNAPIDNPYFWVLMLIMGVIIGYKRFKSNMT